MKLKSAFYVTGAIVVSLLTACGSSNTTGTGALPVSKVTATYLPAGPQVNIPVATATATGGWTVCHSELYNKSNTTLSNVLAKCVGARLMLACRLAGNANYQVLAQAPRADVTFNTTTDQTTVHNANGTDWYYNTNHSWGFSGVGDGVTKNSCDTGNTNPTARLCWHTQNNRLNGGYRCGSDISLNDSTAYERVVLHAD